MNFSIKFDTVKPGWSIIYTEQKWKRYTTIIYILWECIGQKLFTKA